MSKTLLGKHSLTPTSNKQAPSTRMAPRPPSSFTAQRKPGYAKTKKSSPSSNLLVLCRPLLKKPDETNETEKRLTTTTIQRITSLHPSSSILSQDVKRLYFPDGGFGEIEASVEEETNFHAGNAGGNGNHYRKRRVRIRSPVTNHSHASFELPPFVLSSSSSTISVPLGAPPLPDGRGVVERNILCWSTFSERGEKRSAVISKKKLLCALASSSLVQILDVDPSRSKGKKCEIVEGQEGEYDDGDGGDNTRSNMVPLPFEASSIFSTCDQKHLGDDDYSSPSSLTGLLIERCPTVDDANAWNQREFEMAMSNQEQISSNRGGVMEDRSLSKEEDEDENSCTMISGPPQPLRLGEKLLLHRDGGNADIGNNYTAPTTPMDPDARDRLKGGDAITPMAFSVNVPSLFSLRHALDEVRPVALFRSKGDGGEGEVSGLFSDVYERVLFLGQPASLPCICVTFHTRLRRHAVWTVGEAPLSLETPPLWKMHRKNPSDSSLIPIPTPKEEHFSISPSPRPHPSSGVKFTFDNIDMFKTNPDDDPSTNFMSPRLQLLHSQKKNHNIPTSMSRQEDPVTEEEEGALRDDDHCHTSSSLFADIHPDVALTLIWEEDLPSPPPPPDVTPHFSNHKHVTGEDASKESSGYPAGTVFLSSDLRGSLNRICLLCPANSTNPRESIENTSVLRVLSLNGDADKNPLFNVNVVADIPCRSAQPLRTTSGGAVDILISYFEKQKSVLSLYREDRLIVNCGVSLGGAFGWNAKSGERLQNTDNDKKVVDCRIDPDDAPDILALEHPVRNHVNLICRRSDKKNNLPSTFEIRASFSLTFDSSPLAEAVLTCIEMSFRHGVRVDLTSFDLLFPLRLRAECVKIFQALPNLLKDASDEMAEDMGWLTVRTVLYVMLERCSDNIEEESEDNSKDSDSSTSPWEQLLRSEFHREYDRENPSIFSFEKKKKPKSLNIRKPSRSRLEESVNLPLSLGDLEKITFRNKMFDTLHLFYEDCKLTRNSRSRDWVVPLGKFLLEIAVKLGGDRMKDFVDHYLRDLCEGSITELSASKSSSRLTSFVEPPCLFSWMDGMMKGYDCQGYWSPQFDWVGEKINLSYCVSTRRIRRFFCIMFDVSSKNLQERDRTLVLAMVEEGLTDPSDILEEFPLGAALPLMETLHRCRSDPIHHQNQHHWPPTAYILIGRADLAEITEYRINQKPGLDPSSISSRYRGSCGFRLSSSTTNQSQGLAASSTISHDPDQDGLDPLSHFSSMLFPHDHRVREACRLLRSSRPRYLKVHRSPETTDHEFERLKQEKLYRLCKRSLALPLGRGMLSMGTAKPVLAEPLPIPIICLSGRVPPTNATLALDTTHCPTDMTVWPEFHNGVAAGLRLGSNDLKTGSNNSNGFDRITRTWIVYNKPQPKPPSNANNTNANPSQTNENKIDNSHGGLLMALGLQGHLSTLDMTDIYEYLTEGIVTTTVGILLGMAATKRGTCDPSVSKMLCLHLNSLLPPSFAAIEVAGVARSAAVAGIGLLYMRSSHRLMTEFLLNEMGKKPLADHGTDEREGYTLCCGLALGMVNLANGEMGNAGLADLRMEERLHRYIVGGTDDMDITRRRNEAMERAGMVGVSEPEQCSRISEGDLINTDVTAPGAICALGLMFFKSGNKSVASRLDLPDTHFLLDYVRPDLLTLRVVSKALVLWDSVLPTQQWVDDQIPMVVKRSFQQLAIDAKNAAGGFAGLAGFTNMSMETTDDTHANRMTNINTPAKKKTQDDSSPYPNPFDRQAIRQAHAHILSGTCLALGLRYAGTANPSAKSTIITQILHFNKLREDNDPVSLAQRPERPILEMCLHSSATALAMVMAGTGDLETFCLFRQLRWRCEEEVRYGSHMAYGAAIGLLFLGGGACTLGREPEHIAALLMAFFPRFPAHTEDNQYHLQALRHCYVMAVQRREFEVVDVDTREPVYLPVEVTYKNGHTDNVTAPFLLANKGIITKLKIKSERYFPIELNFSDDSDIKPTPTSSASISTNLTSHLPLLVKKKSGHLTYAQDPHALRSLLVQTGGSKGGGSALNLIRYFSEEPILLAFAKYLCDGGPVVSSGFQKDSGIASSERRRQIGYKFEEFCTDVLRECLTQEKPEAVSLYLSIQSFVDLLERGEFSSRDKIVGNIWDIRLVTSYYQYANRVCHDGSNHCYSSSSSTTLSRVPRLLSSDFLALVHETVDRVFANRGFSGNTLSAYADGKSWNDFGDCPANMAGSFLVWYDVPFLPM